jgi:hypothetical protein
MKKLTIILIIFLASCGVPPEQPGQETGTIHTVHAADVDATGHYCTGTIQENLMPVKDVPEDAKYIEPGDFQTWGELMKGATYFVFAPGDYRALGVLKLEGAKGLTFRAQHSSENTNLLLYPGLRDPAIIEGFFLTDCESVNLIGFDVTGNSEKRDGLQGGPTNKLIRVKNSLFSHLYLSDVLGIAVLRALDVSGNYFQSSMFEGAFYIDRKDTGGFQISGTTKLGSYGNRVLDNHFLNLTDAFSFGKTERKNYQDSPEDIDPSGYVCGILVMGNQFEIDSTIYNTDGTAKAENLIDLKNGCDTKEGENLFTMNRYQGSRPTAGGGTGSTGEAIVLQRAAQHIRFEKEVVYNCAAGFTFNQQTKTIRKNPEPGISGLKI